jgi:hypothetical protein
MPWEIVTGVRDLLENSERLGREGLGRRTRNRRSARDPLMRRERGKAQRVNQGLRDRVGGRNRRAVGHVESSKRHGRT